MKTISLKPILTIAAVTVAMTLGAPTLSAQDFGGHHYGPGPGMFVDENGDGINDLAPDADNDGIPNRLDEDYVRPLDGSGYGHRWGAGNNADGTSVGQRRGGRGPGNGTGECVNEGS